MSQARQKTSFIISILLLMFVQMSTDIYLPSLPTIAMDWNVSTAAVKLTISAMIIALGLSQLYFGFVSDSLGRRIVILRGLCIYTIGSLLAVFTHNICILIIARIIQGIGLGFGLCISSAVASDIYQGKKFYQSLSIISIVYAVMPVLAPIIGGSLQTWIDWHASFWLLLLCGVLMLGLTYFFFYETKHVLNKKPALTDIMETYKQLLGNQCFNLHLLILVAFYASEVAYVIQMPLIVQNVFSVTPMMTGWLMIFTSFSIVIGSALSTILLKEFKPRSLIRLGVLCAILATGFWFLAILNHRYTLVTFILPMMLFMFGSGLAFPNAMGVCLDCFPDKAGAASSLAIGGLTLLGGLLTLVIAKLPAEVNYALPLFIAVLVFFMISAEYCINRVRGS